MDGWVGGRKEGRKEAKAGLRIAYSNQKMGKSQKQAGLAGKIENHKKSNTKILKDD